MVDEVKRWLVEDQKERLLWREACSDSDIGSIWKWNLVIAAEAVVCNGPGSCNHNEVIQSYFDAVVSLMMKASKRC